MSSVLVWTGGKPVPFTHELTVHGYSAEQALEALNKRLNGIGFGMGNVLKERQSVDLEITPLE